MPGVIFVNIVTMQAYVCKFRPNRLVVALKISQDYWVPVVAIQYKLAHSNI